MLLLTTMPDELSNRNGIGFACRSCRTKRGTKALKRSVTRRRSSSTPLLLLLLPLLIGCFGTTVARIKYRMPSPSGTVGVVSWRFLTHATTVKKKLVTFLSGLERVTETVTVCDCICMRHNKKRM